MFARKVNVYFIKAILIALVNLVVVYFIAHYMGPEPLGLLGFATAYITMFSIVSNLGFDPAHVKRVSEGKDLGKCIGTYFTFKIIIVLLIIILVLSSLLIQKYILHFEFDHPEQERIIILLLIPTALTQIALVPMGTFEAERKSAKAAVPFIVAPIVRAPISISVAVLGLGVYGLLGARIVKSIIIFSLLFFYFRKYPIKRPNKSYFKNYFSFAWKITLYSMFAVIALQISRILLGLYVSIEDVGRYSSITVISGFLLIIPGAVKTILFPTVSKYHAENNTQKAIKYVHLSEKYILMLVTPIALTIAYYSDQVILLILGDEFLSASTALKLLCIWLIIDGTKTPFLSQIAGVDRVGIVVIISSFTIALHILLNIILIPDEIHDINLPGWGMNGAATAALISGCVLAVLSRIAAYKVAGTTFRPQILCQYFAGIVMIAFYYSIDYYYPVDAFTIIESFFLISILGIIGTCIFIGILYIFKEFTKTDYLMFYNALNPKKMRTYIKHELNE